MVDTRFGLFRTVSARGAKADLFLGGWCPRIAVAYDQARSTRDLDAAFLRGLSDRNHRPLPPSPIAGLVPSHQQHRLRPGIEHEQHPDRDIPARPSPKEPYAAFSTTSA